MYVSIPETPFIALAEDTSISRECVNRRRLSWDDTLFTTPEIQERVDRGAVMVDVGAYIGDTAVQFAQAGCVVYAFEPRADAFHCLKHNLSRYATANVFQYAVGANSTDFVGFRPSKDTNLGGRQIEVSTDGEVETFALDSLGLQRLDILKIDAEGFEPYVLAGALNTIVQRKPVLFIEVNQPSLRSYGFEGKEDIYRKLDVLNYDFRVLQKERENTDLPYDIVCTAK